MFVNLKDLTQNGFKVSYQVRTLTNSLPDRIPFDHYVVAEFESKLYTNNRMPFQKFLKTREIISLIQENHTVVKAWLENNIGEEGIDWIMHLYDVKFIIFFKTETSWITFKLASNY
jgi:hypothetical protein